MFILKQWIQQDIDNPTAKSNGWEQTELTLVLFQFGFCIQSFYLVLVDDLQRKQAVVWKVMMGVQAVKHQRQELDEQRKGREG